MDERSFSPVVGLLRDQLTESFWVSLRLCRESFYNGRLNGVTIMFRRKNVYVVLVVLLLVTMVSVNAQYRRRIPSGVWGGAHININVGAKSAAIEYDCAHGAIDGPLTIDKAGNFNLRGTHVAERGGPVRAGESSEGQPATYTGSIQGTTMTLTLKVGDSEPETFTLEKGKTGELVKCK
jgi:hypothetical protein